MFDPELINRAVRRIAEDRIREAEEKGLFDNLPGHGKPLPPIEEGLPDQHLMSWVRSWMQRSACRTCSASRPARSSVGWVRFPIAPHRANAGNATRTYATDPLA